MGGAGACRCWNGSRSFAQPGPGGAGDRETARARPVDSEPRTATASRMTARITAPPAPGSGPARRPRGRLEQSAEQFAAWLRHTVRTGCPACLTRTNVARTARIHTSAAARRPSMSAETMPLRPWPCAGVRRVSLRKAAAASLEISVPGPAAQPPDGPPDLPGVAPPTTAVRTKRALSSASVVLVRGVRMPAYAETSATFAGWHNSRMLLAGSGG